LGNRNGLALSQQVYSYRITTLVLSSRNFQLACVFRDGFSIRPFHEPDSNCMRVG
jgi:hypothetical protein